MLQARFPSLRRAHVGALIAAAALAGAILAAAFAGGGADPANAAPATTKPGGSAARTIQVIGTATVEVAPDRAILVAGVQVDGADASQAASQAATKLNALMRAIGSTGIPANRMQSGGLQVEPRYAGDMQERIAGFRATGQLTITIDDISTVGAVIDNARGAGANMIQSVTWTLKNPAAAQRQALSQAAQDGIGQANAVARGAGVQAGRLLAVETIGADPVIPYAERAADAALAADATPTAPGLIPVTGRVKMTFAMIG